MIFYEGTCIYPHNPAYIKKYLLVDVVVVVDDLVDDIVLVDEIVNKSVAEEENQNHIHRTS